MPIQGKHDDTDWIVEYRTDSGETDFLTVSSSKDEKFVREQVQRILDAHNRNPDSPDQRELVSLQIGSPKKLRRLAAERAKAGNQGVAPINEQDTDTGSGE